jgi:hypothetical protein
MMWPMETHTKGKLQSKIGNNLDMGKSVDLSQEKKRAIRTIGIRNGV